MKKLILLFVVIFFSQTVVAETTKPKKKVLIDKILEQTGQSAIQVGKQFSDLFIQQMTMVLKSSNKNIDPRAFSIIEEEVKNIINEEIVENKKIAEMMYPIYTKHFTVDELKQMIELNNTPFGRKMIKVMPLITQEAMQAGQIFGQTLAPKIQRRLLDRFEKEGIK